MPDLAKVVPIFNVESIEAGERVEQLASRRKVEFESIDFNKRYLATVPADHDPIALRELFSPGFLDWAAQIRNEVEFGITDRQLYFSWRLADRTAEATPRRSIPPRGCSRGCATRWRSRASTPICPAPGTRAWNRFRTPSRGPGGVPSRSCKTASGGS